MTRITIAEKSCGCRTVYLANDSRAASRTAAPTRAQNNLPETGFVFANFNAGYKLTPQVFAAWMRILKQVEGSVLWQLEGVAAFRDNLRREAAAHGIAPEGRSSRLSLAMEDHLARLTPGRPVAWTPRHATSHTTASDALWAGLPLITCRGTAFSGRVAASLLSAVGLPELITENLDDYEKLAVKLARDPKLLASIRGKLAANRLTAPLLDIPADARLSNRPATM